jgi:putative transcriptional regulator
MPKKPPISNNIATLREETDRMSQASLAKAIGVSRQTVVAIEKGHYSPSLESAFRISRVFNVTLEDVFVWDED